MSIKRPEVLLLVGMSGAGRSASSNVFEDLGYYVIENLPPDLVESVVQSNDVAESNRQLVLTVDAREGVAQGELNKSLDRLSQSGVLTRVIFLDADIIIKNTDLFMEKVANVFKDKKIIATTPKISVDPKEETLSDKIVHSLISHISIILNN